MHESDEAPGVPTGDVQDVSNYIAAMNHGMDRLRGGFPLSLRLILSNGRGSEKQPGEFRRSQNWIGGTRPDNALFVPPPPELVLENMGSLELFLHSENPGIPVLIKAGLAHVQFEPSIPSSTGTDGWDAC